MSGTIEFTGYTTLRCDFTALKVIENTVSAEPLTLSVKLAIEDIGHEHADYLINKLKFWMDQLLDNTFVFDAGREAGFKIAFPTTNNLMTCPGEPTDTLLTLLLLRKLKSIVPDGLVFLAVEIKNDYSNSSATITSLRVTEELPEFANEYCALELYPEEKSWWNRNDCFTYEFPLVDDVSKEEAYADSVHDIFKEFDEVYNLHDDNDDSDQEIIRVKAWKPKLA